MSALVRTFSGSDVLNNGSPSTSPIINTRNFQLPSETPVKKKVMPLGLTKSQNDVFNDIMNPSAFAAESQEDAVEAQPAVVLPPVESFAAPSVPSGGATASASASLPGPVSYPFSNDILPTTLFETDGVYVPAASPNPFNISASSPASSSSDAFWTHVQGSPAGTEMSDIDSFHPDANQAVSWSSVFTNPVPPASSFVPQAPSSPQGPLVCFQDVPLIPAVPALPKQSAKNKKSDGFGPRRSNRKGSVPRKPYARPDAEDLSEDEFVGEASDVGNGDKPFKCDMCSTRFTRDFERTRHMKAHETLPNLQCGICQKVIKNGRTDALRRHQLRTRKCVQRQEGMTDAQLAAAGCVTSTERKLWKMRTQAQPQF